MRHVVERGFFGTSVEANKNENRGFNVTQNVSERNVLILGK
jgi:hypothetical protein